MAAGRFLQKSGKFMTVVDNSMQILMLNKALASYQVTLATDMVLNSYAITCIAENEVTSCHFWLKTPSEVECLFFFFFFITACIERSPGKSDLPRTGSSARAFSVMCCNSLVPVVLWCWCFVCWSFWHPVGCPLHGQASKLAPSPLIHAAAGALTLNPMLEVKKKVGCGMFLEQTLQRISSRSPEQDLVLPCIFVGRSGWREEAAFAILGPACISRITYILTNGNFVFWICDLKMGQINS